MHVMSAACRLTGKASLDPVCHLPAVVEQLVSTVISKAFSSVPVCERTRLPGRAGQVRCHTLH